MAPDDPSSAANATPTNRPTSATAGNSSDSSSSGGLPCYSGIEIVFECGGSYAGYCDHETGSCVCINGWSGKADGGFNMDLRPYGGRVLDCPPHVPTLRALYGIMLVICAALFIFHAAYVLPKAARSYRKSSRTKARHWTCFKPLHIELMVMTTFALLSALAATKIADAEWEWTLLGYHAPTNVLCLAYVAVLVFLGYTDFMTRRDALLKKKLFLRGEEDCAISRQLMRGHWKFRAVNIAAAASYLCLTAFLPMFPPSADDSTLPFGSGRFLLSPASEVIIIITQLLYREFLKQDMASINELFDKIANMTKGNSSSAESTGDRTGTLTTTTTTFTGPQQVQRKITGRTVAALHHIETSRRKLQSYYQRTRKSLLATAFASGIILVVPPLWPRYSWWLVCQYLLYTPAIHQLSQSTTPPKASGGGGGGGSGSSNSSSSSSLLRLGLLMRSSARAIFGRGSSHLGSHPASVVPTLSPGGSP